MPEKNPIHFDPPVKVVNDKISVEPPEVDKIGAPGLPQDTLAGHVANLPPELSCVRNKFIFSRVPVAGIFINVKAVVAVARVMLKLFPVLPFITYEEVDDVAKFIGSL